MPIGAPPRISREECEARIEVIHECMGEGFAYPGTGGQHNRGATQEAARRLGVTRQTVLYTIEVAETRHDLKIDPSRYVRRSAGFSIELPDEQEMTAEEHIELLKAQSAERQAADDGKRLYRVQVDIDGPIGIAIFGDMHVDSPGCDWVALDRDIRLVRGAEGVLAVNVGDTSDNWVGRLAALYAQADVTVRQAQKLIEWVLVQIPWLLTIGGNHDLWHTETADPLEIIHRMQDLPGLYQGHGARLELVLPCGESVRLHVRHDFPGRSQFNASHALVRETLFGYRDHILACGHRHQAGYIPIWHNDPPRLCHGIRVGSYKTIDAFQHEKHFKDENWSPAMMAVIDPAFASDPVRFITFCRSITEGIEVLAWRRAEWCKRK